MRDLQLDKFPPLYLMPGEFAFGDRTQRYQTVLGSCVAITLWHPKLRVGGMCHFKLPSNPNAKQHQLDGAYADDAIEMFRRAATRRDTKLKEYQAKVFGGSLAMSQNSKHQQSSERVSIGEKNIHAALLLLAQERIAIMAEDVRGTAHRRVIFDVRTGHVWVSH